MRGIAACEARRLSVTTPNYGCDCFVVVVVVVVEDVTGGGCKVVVCSVVVLVVFSVLPQPMSKTVFATSAATVKSRRQGNDVVMV
jgi:hypothetical protein